MARIETYPLLIDLKKDVNEIIEQARTEFASLSVERLTWKPSPKKWSVLECVEHMNIGFRHYVPLMEKGIREFKDRGGIVQFSYKPGYFGNMLSKSMKPTADRQIKSVMKTFGKFDPVKQGQKTDDPIGEFIDWNLKLLDLLEEGQEVDAGRIKVTSIIGPVLRFKLGDAFRFTVAHNQRHVLQAQRVIAAQLSPMAT